MSQTVGLKVGRLDAIRSHLYAHGFSTIQALAESVGASLATIRRDLQVLEREGSIDRLPGTGEAQPRGKARDRCGCL
jgi:DeoR/GlpR family transcriptional regulator of sugar metabolism